MDLIATYSNSSPSSTPANSPPGSPGRPAPVTSTAVAHPLKSSISGKKLVTGTVETIQFSDTNFTKLETFLDTTGTAIDPQTGSVIRPRLHKTTLPPVSQKRSGTAAPQRTLPSSGARKRRRATPPPPLLPTSQLHVSNTHDYQNRSWLAAPSSSRTFEQLETYTPYVPKRFIFETHAHNQGVSLARFFPAHGHLLLTAGLDGAAHIWRVTDTLKRIRTYSGHSKGIRDASFTHDGKSFLTAGYDRCIRLWDTETGRVVGNYTVAAIPYCTRFSPLHDGNEFLAGCGDNKIIQIDVRNASNIVQQYDQHMGAVNSISFVDDDRRFVSSADDKVLRLWEYGVPVVIRDVADPAAHSMPVTMLHPNRKWLACQSMDNSVRIFTARDKFKPNPKKSFKGHLVAGYACGLTTSPDGRFLASADSLGRLFFWDWKTARILNAHQAHDGVCIGVDWHPTRSSTVVSCGWDGKIKLWD